MHTYPESHPEGGLCTFRADIDVSTCGVISPLKALNYLIHQLESDIVTIDYRVCGPPVYIPSRPAPSPALIALLLSHIALRALPRALSCLLFITH